MNGQFLKSDRVYMSVISGYNLYLDSGKRTKTISCEEAINVTHINSGEEYYLVKLNSSKSNLSLNDWINVILNPACKNFFWPIDIVEADDNYLVFPCKFISDVTSLNELANKEDFLGLEKSIIKPIISNLLQAFISLYSHSYLYHIWDDKKIFISRDGTDLLISFCDALSLVDKEEKVVIGKDLFYSEYTDPYIFSKDCSYDYNSEMYALAAIIFHLLIGRFPYEGGLLDSVPKDSENWMNSYIDTPVFIFDKHDNRNAIGDFSNEKIFLRRWNSLTDEMKNMFCNLFTESNIMRKREIAVYSPIEWLDAVSKFDFKLKN